MNTKAVVLDKQITVGQLKELLEDVPDHLLVRIEDYDTIVEDRVVSYDDAYCWIVRL